MEVKQLYGQYWHDRFKMIIDAYVNFWKNVINFRGKISRWEVVYFSIGFTIATFGLSIICSILSMIMKSGIPFTVLGIYFIVYLIGSLSMTIRRLHDVNRRWFNILWWLLPIIGWYILIIALWSPGVDELCQMYGYDNGTDYPAQSQAPIQQSQPVYEPEPKEEPVRVQSSQAAQNIQPLNDIQPLEEGNTTEMPEETVTQEDIDLSNEEITLD